jgi:D-3-phosphoglycerate dehydrogenase
MNIDGMSNKSKGDYAYALIDVNTTVSDSVISELSAAPGVLKVRKVK